MGMLLERPGGSYLVLQDGHLIREDLAKGSKNVVAFETYALDLSQIGAQRSSGRLRIPERSTAYLLAPAADDESVAENPASAVAEIHNRMSAPLFTLAFAFIALGLLGTPRTTRQDRSFAIFATVLICMLLRAAGFAAAATAPNWELAIPFLYLVPIAGIGLGAYLTLGDVRPRMPRALESALDRGFEAIRHITRRASRQADAAALTGRP